MQRKGNDRIINASLLMRTCIRHWGLLSLNANVQWKRPCTMPSGILFDVVSRYPPGFLCVPVDLYTGLPTRLLISMDASPEPSHSSIEKGGNGDREGGKSRLDVGRTFILYLYRSPVCFIVLANKSLREKLFHLTRSPRRRMPNSLKRAHTWDARWIELYCISQRDSFERIPLPLEFSSNCAFRSFLSWTIGPMFIRWSDWLHLASRLSLSCHCCWIWL